MANIILHQVGSVSVGLDRKDGYLNATKLCAAYTSQTKKVKRPEHWLSTKAAKEYIAYVSGVTGIPVTDLVVVRQGGTPEEQGTWVHPDLADSFAAWLSVEYQYNVSQWLQNWRSGKADNKFPDSTIGKVEKHPEQQAIESISVAIDCIFGGTSLDKNLIAGIKAEAIAANYPQYRPALEAAKSTISLPLTAKLLTVTELAALLEERTGEKISAVKLNKLLAEKGLQQSTGKDSPRWEPIGRGFDHSQMVADTAKGHAKTVVTLKWFNSVLDLL
ncbi:MAG: KilA-N domain-containing protein [Microcoleus sp.]